jgi:DhnA family fructose-bisphosphate aldolase class Ia
MVTKKKNMATEPFVPADVASCSCKEYSENFTSITRGSGRIFMFAADQKIEHLNYDFYGPGIDATVNDPEHIFRIAQDGSIGALAVHAGLIARYGRAYNTINYIVKLNGKTSLTPAQGSGPMSALMWDIQDVLYLANENNLKICGIGYTIYLGSSYESSMLSQAAQLVLQAHQEGLVVVLWIYPRAAHIKDEADPELIAGAAGLGNALGADFVKVHVPHAHNKTSRMQALKVASVAAGNTGIICAGGEFVQAKGLLKSIYEQLDEGGSSGCAIGRNVFQRPYAEAVALTRAISALVYERASYVEAERILHKK